MLVHKGLPHTISEQRSGTTPRVTSKYFLSCISRLLEICPKIGAFSFPEAIDTIEKPPHGFNPKEFETFS